MGKTYFTNFAEETSYQTKNNILSKGINGFIDRTKSDMAFNESTRTFTITPNDTSYGVFSLGKLNTISAALGLIIPDVDGLNYVYIDADGAIQQRTSFDIQLIAGPWAYVTVLTWDAVNSKLSFGSFQDERHELMDFPTHILQHTENGLVSTGGLGLTGFDNSEDGTSETCTQFGRDAGTIADEDIAQSLAARASTVSPQVSYLAGDTTPGWRNGAAITSSGTCILLDTGVPQYIKLTGAIWALEDVPDGNYFNCHVIVTTNYDGDKREIIVPGSAVYESKSAAIVGQLDEVYALALKAQTSSLDMSEFKAIGSVLFKYDSTYTNSTKCTTVAIGGGLDYQDLISRNISNGKVRTQDLVIPPTLVREVTDDFTFAVTDMEVHVKTPSGQVVGTLPDISTLTRTDIKWVVQKIASGAETDGNPFRLTLAVLADSQCGTDIYTYELTVPGAALEIVITEEGKYSIRRILCARDAITNVKVSTLTPSLASTTLSLFGDLTDIAADTEVDVSFRYRIIGGLAWTTSTGQNVTANGDFTETPTVTAAEDYEVQAMVEDKSGTMHYGEVLNTLVNHYTDYNEARLAGCKRYWDLQETSGTDAVGAEKLNALENTANGTSLIGEDMICHDGVTISSDTINSNTIYRREFTSIAFMEAAFKQPSNEDFTIIIQVDMRTISADHTVFSCGRNIVSLGADNTKLELNVDRSFTNYTPPTPTGMTNFAIRVNKSRNLTEFLEVTTTTVTSRLHRWRTPRYDFSYLRIANGTRGDSGHQDGEFGDNMGVRSIAVFDHVVPDSVLMDIAKTLDTEGMLIV